MPIYEYRCPSGHMAEALLPIAERDTPQTCFCGQSMTRVASIPQPPVMKPTGKDMALDSLNGRSTGYMKPEHKAAAARGLERPEKTIY